MPNKFGLSFKAPKKKTAPVISDTNVFDSYGDESTEKGRVEDPFKRTKIPRADQQIIEDAVREDPLIFEYDEVFEERRPAPKERVQRQEREKPRYIHNLLKASEERQAERERRIERRIQEERKQEGEMYADKEVFVTNAYRERLRAMEEMDRARIEAEKEEALLDVRKQGNLNSFYRFMLKNGMFGNQKEEATADVLTEAPRQPAIVKRKASRSKLRKRRSDSEESNEKSEEPAPAEEDDGDPGHEAVASQEQAAEAESVAEPAGQGESKDSTAANTADEAQSEKSSLTKEEIMKKLEERVNKIFQELQKKTVDERFLEAVEEYQVRKNKRLQQGYVNPQLQIDAN